MATDQASEPVQIKPCDVPCAKCGSDNINRVFREKGATWGRGSDLFNHDADIDNEFVQKKWGHPAEALQDHIYNRCLTCKYEFYTAPLIAESTPCTK